MSTLSEPWTNQGTAALCWRPSWRWVHVAVAALAMVATLPGRTHGLGLVTEPLLRDLGLDRVDYAVINLWATLLGAAFCLPCGWLLDRLGVRWVLAVLLLLLGGVVVAMSRVRGGAAVDVPVPSWLAESGSLTVGVLFSLFVLVLLTRGLGQSALSVVSLALLGKTAGRRPGPVVGVYSFLTALGFMAAFALVKRLLEGWDLGWRSLWAGIGGVLLFLGPLAWLLVRPAAAEWREEAGERGPTPSRPVGLTLGQALRTPAFWAFALTTSLYALIAAGVSLFNESILRERGFDRSVFLSITALTPLVGLASNLATGWLAARWPPGRLLALAMVLLMVALLSLPLVETLPQVYVYAAEMGVAGGMVTVLFFSVWGQVFGPAHLGKIQGAAQMLTVLASAGGPLLLAACQRWTGSYVPLFQGAALAAGLLGLCAGWVPVPRFCPPHSTLSPRGGGRGWREGATPDAR